MDLKKILITLRNVTDVGYIEHEKVKKSENATIAKNTKIVTE